jgi:hypothetical protein
VRKASLWKKQGAATTRRQKANQPEDRARSTKLRKSKTPGRTKEFFKGVGYIKDGLAGPSPTPTRGGGVRPAQSPGKGALSSPYPCAATPARAILEPRLLSEGPDALGEYRVSPSPLPIRRGIDWWRDRHEGEPEPEKETGRQAPP